MYSLKQLLQKVKSRFLRVKSSSCRSAISASLYFTISRGSMAQDPTKPNRELSQPCIGHDAIHNFDAMVEMFGKILAKKNYLKFGCS